MDDTGTELAIRSRRAAFNRAIRDGDAAAIGSLLSRDCVMLTGTDSAVISGRLAQIKVWRREFASTEREVYERSPQSVDVSSAHPVAMEHGVWRALHPSGAVTANGTYAAKWRMVAGDWLIEAEVFATLE